MPSNSSQILLVVFAFLCGHSSVYASQAVQVSRVDFEKVGRQDWIRCRIEIQTGRNPIPEAKNSQFIDDLNLELLLSYGHQRTGFEFYQQEVDIVSAEMGERYYVDFFLPGVVFERDQLDIEPFAYLIRIKASQNSIPFDPSHASSNLSGSSAAREAMLTEIAERAPKNAGVLLKPYHAPFFLTNDGIESYPAFRRLNE